MAEHANIAPSALARIFQCPGSVQLSEGLPDTSSKYADEGSLAHEVAALIMDNCQNGIPVSNTLDEIAAGMHVFEYGSPDDKMLRHVEDYVDAMLAIVALDPDAYFEVEQRVQATADVWGTCDFWAWLPSAHTLVVRDLKYGAGEFVRIEGNKQARAYALGALKKLQQLDMIEQDIELLTVDIGVYQPRNRGVEDEAHRSEVLVFADLANFETQLLDLAGRVNVGKEFKDGECRWCKAAMRCPLNNEAVLELEIASSLTVAELEATNEQLAYWLDCGPRFKRFLAEVAWEARNRAELGDDIPGYELKQHLRNREWVDEGAAFNALVMLTPPGEGTGCLFKQPVLKSPAQIEQLGEHFKTAVKGLTHRLSAGYSLDRIETTKEEPNE